MDQTRILNSACKRARINETQILPGKHTDRQKPSGRCGTAITLTWLGNARSTAITGWAVHDQPPSLAGRLGSLGRVKPRPRRAGLRVPIVLGGRELAQARISNGLTLLTALQPAPHTPYIIKQRPSSTCADGHEAKKSTTIIFQSHLSHPMLHIPEHWLPAPPIAVQRAPTPMVSGSEDSPATPTLTVVTRPSWRP